MDASSGVRSQESGVRIKTWFGILNSDSWLLFLRGPIMPSASFYSRIGRLSSIIFVLPSCMAVGGLLGYYLIDRYFGVYPWGTVILVLLGAAAGFYEIVKILILDQRSKGA
jgi:hypothetical protein